MVQETFSKQNSHGWKCYGSLMAILLCISLNEHVYWGLLNVGGYICFKTYPVAVCSLQIDWMADEKLEGTSGIS